MNAAAALPKGRAPWYCVRDEDPIHVCAAHLSVRGMSFARIARAFGKSAAWMCNLARQRFFEERCAAIVETINGDMIQQMHRRRRLRPLLMVAMHDCGGSCDVPAGVSYAIDLLNRPICEASAVKAKKPRPRAASNTKPAPEPMPAPIPVIEPEPAPEPSWQAIVGDDEENYFAETAVTPPPKPVNPREAARRSLAEFAEIDRLENYRKYCP
jgi:hypothetical protein